MQMFDTGDVRLHYRVDGPDDGAPVVFSNSLGTDMRLWDQVLPLLPAGLRIIRYDKRGHGLSSCPPAPYKMGALVGDVEKLMDHLWSCTCPWIHILLSYGRSVWARMMVYFLYQSVGNGHELDLNDRARNKVVGQRK